MDTEFKRGHRYTKEDVSNLVIILNDGEKSSKELYQALKEKGLYQTGSESDSVKGQRIIAIMKFARTVLGEGAVKEIRKPLSGTGGRGGCRSMKYFSLSSSKEELNRRIEAYKPTRRGKRKNASTEEKKVEEEVRISTQPDPLDTDPLRIKKDRLLRITGEITAFFENTQNYSPRQFEDLLKRVSASGFSSPNLIEVVISSFKEAEKAKIEEIEKRYLT